MQVSNPVAAQKLSCPFCRAEEGLLQREKPLTIGFYVGKHAQQCFNYNYFCTNCKKDF